jgi:hypothetical protein
MVDVGALPLRVLHRPAPASLVGGPGLTDGLATCTCRTPSAVTVAPVAGPTDARETMTPRAGEESMLIVDHPSPGRRVAGNWTGPAGRAKPPTGVATITAMTLRRPGGRRPGLRLFVGGAASLSPSIAAANKPRRRVTPALRQQSQHHETTQARPQPVHSRSQLAGLPPSTPPRTTCTGASYSRDLVRRYDDEDLSDPAEPEPSPTRHRNAVIVRQSSTKPPSSDEGDEI